jgi:streptogramin lyase
MVILSIETGHAEPWEFSKLVGLSGLSGYADSNGLNAKFNSPQGTATDANGNVFVADTNSHTIRKISSQGFVTTLAGKAGLSGYANGAGAAALFNFPRAITTDPAGNVYVCDSSNQVIRKITSTGLVSTLAGQPNIPGSADGPAASASFRNPTAIAYAPTGDLYIADTNNHAIRKIAPDGTVSTLAGLAGSTNFGYVDATGSAARFRAPNTAAVSPDGNIYVSDTWNDRVRKITPAGVVTSLTPVFPNPRGIAIRSTGELIVSDTSFSTLSSISASGTASLFAGTLNTYGSTDGPAEIARFYSPIGISLDTAGNCYVADSSNQTVRKVSPSGVTTTLAGQVGMAGSDDTSGANITFNGPRGLAIDSTGTTWLADTDNHLIRKVLPSGITFTYSGQPLVDGSANGPLATAEFSSPSDIALTPDGNAYVADTANHVIRRISTSGIVSTFAGTAGTYGNTDGVGSAALFRSPSGIAADLAGNLYVADRGNHTIRKISPGGNVITLAGKNGISGSIDATGILASFRNPTGIAVDSSGNCYVADQNNHTIRMIDSVGVVTTLAGAPGVSGTQDGTSSGARFSQPSAVEVSPNGTLFVTDQGSGAIRQISPTGVVTTISDPVQPLNSPRGIALDSKGSLIISNSNQHTLMRVDPPLNTLPDADGDGYSDLQEQAQGLPTSATNTGYSAPVSLSTAGWPASNSPLYQHFTFRTLPGMTHGYFYQLQQSPDLFNWQDLDMKANQVGPSVRTTDPIPVDLLTLRADQPITARPANFMRLKICPPWPPSSLTRKIVTLGTLKQHINNTTLELLPTNNLTKEVYDAYSETGNSAWSRFAWTNRIDLSGVSWDGSRSKDCTLISPRHIVMAEHWPKEKLDQVIFHDRFGNRYTRTIIDIVKTQIYNPDIRIGLLDTAVPLKFYKVLPRRSDWQTHLQGGLCFMTNQFRQVGIRRINTINNTLGPSAHPFIDFTLDSILPSFYQPNLIPGDSGNPSFIMVRGEPVLISTFTGGGAGSGPFFSLPINYDAINAAMNTMDSTYQLTPVELDN